MSARLEPRRLRRLLGATVLACLVAGLAAQSALAHATLIRSDPPDGSTVASAPETIRLWFDEQPVPRFSTAEVLDDEGRAVAGVTVEIDADEKLFVLTLPEELERGLYSIDWKVLSAEDAHFRRGIVVFGVGAGLRAAPGATQRPVDEVAAADVLLRWANLAALAFLVGAVAVAGFVLRPLASGGSEDARAARSAQRRLLPFGAGAAALGAAAGVGLLARQAVTISDAAGSSSLATVAADFLLQTRSGALWLAREGIYVALLVLLVAAVRRGIPRLGLIGALVVAAVGSEVLAGHAAAVSPRTGLVVVVATLHVLAAGLWIGGLAAGLVALWPLFGRRRAGNVALARSGWRRFGTLAAAGVGLLAATGLYYAARQVASLDALLTTLYGQTLLVKVGLMLAAGLLGSVNVLLLERGRMRRAFFAAEVGVGAAVLLTVGILTTAVPARGPEFDPVPASEAVPTSLSSAVDDVLVTLTARPNQAGPNVFQVIAASSRRPPPAEITGVTLRFRGTSGEPVTAQLVEVEPGRYRTSGGYLTAAGAWQVDVSVQRDAGPELVAAFDWRVAPAAARSVVVSDRPIGPLLTVAAIAVALGGLALAAWTLHRRRPFRRLARAPTPRPEQVT